MLRVWGEVNTTSWGEREWKESPEHGRKGRHYSYGQGRGPRGQALWTVREWKENRKALQNQPPNPDTVPLESHMPLPSSSLPRLLPGLGHEPQERLAGKKGRTNVHSDLHGVNVKYSPLCKGGH